jgi:hypothetical protein
MKAELIKEFPANGVGAVHKHYRLSSPIKDRDGTEHEYVIVSAVDAMITGPETYIFPADDKGSIVDFCELDGSFRGERDHEQALSNAGYEVVESL